MMRTARGFKDSWGEWARLSIIRTHAASFFFGLDCPKSGSADLNCELSVIFVRIASDVAYVLGSTLGHSVTAYAIAGLQKAVESEHNFSPLPGKGRSIRARQLHDRAMPVCRA